MRVRISLKGKILDIPNVKICENKALGLMFSSKNHDPLLFQFAKPRRWAIHSFFVFYPFIAIWMLDKKVIDFAVIKPFTLSVKPKSAFTHLLEIPLHEHNQELLNSIVDA